MKYRRVLLKISGEMLGRDAQSFNYRAFDYIAGQLKSVHRRGVKIGLVVGGGNIIRGRAAEDLDRIDADQCGMMATVINGMVLRNALKKEGIRCLLSSAIEIPGMVKKADNHDDKAMYDDGVVIIFVGGTGNPLFTTDTAAALRAAELKVDILVKGTKVRGIYSSDPAKHRRAVFYPRLDFREALRKNLKVMDAAAFSICQETNTPICVYEFLKYPLYRVIKGDNVGTLVINGG